MPAHCPICGFAIIGYFTVCPDCGQDMMAAKKITQLWDIEEDDYDDE